MFETPSSKPERPSRKERAEARKQAHAEKDPVRWFLELLVIVAVVAGFFFGILQPFVVKPFRIPSESMVPTLEIGQRVLVNRLGTRFGHPDVGDVVVFRPPVGATVVPPLCGAPSPAGAACDTPTPEKSKTEYFVKRIVGGPGDKLRIVDGHVIRNGKPAKEPFAQPCTGECDFPKEITIPKGYYYMMGDNRGFSADSRYWGPVPEKWIIGAAFATYWPPKRIGGVG